MTARRVPRLPVLDVVVADVGTLRDLAVEGATADAIVVSGITRRRRTRAAFARATGERLPDDVEPIAHARPSALAVGGIRVTVRDRKLVRVHPDGWIEEVWRLATSSDLVVTESFVMQVEKGIAYMVQAEGRIIEVRLPPWAVGRAQALPQARVVVIANETQIAWLTYETIATLRAIAPSTIKLRATLTGGDGEVTVTRGGSRGAVVEGTNGKRIVLTEHLPVMAGERLAVTLSDGVNALVNRSGEVVARENKIEMVRTGSKQTAGHPPFETTVLDLETPGQHAQSFLTPSVRNRATLLRMLGIAPSLDESALHEAANVAFGRAVTAAPRQTALVVAKILYAHLQAHPQPRERTLVGDDAIDVASQKAVRAGHHWYSVVYDEDRQPFALCLSPSEHAEIVANDLLVLVPVPTHVPPPADAAAARDQLIKFLGCAPDDVTLVRGKTARFTLRLSVRAAALLDRRLPT